MQLQDTHNYLAKEIETWETWNLNQTTSLKSQIKDLAGRWLKEWTEKFKVVLTFHSYFRSLFCLLKYEVKVKIPFFSCPTLLQAQLRYKLL